MPQARSAPLETTVMSQNAVDSEDQLVPPKVLYIMYTTGLVVSALVIAVAQFIWGALWWMVLAVAICAAGYTALKAFERATRDELRTPLLFLGVSVGALLVGCVPVLLGLLWVGAAGAVLHRSGLLLRDSFRRAEYYSKWCLIVVGAATYVILFFGIVLYVPKMFAAPVEESESEEAGSGQTPAPSEPAEPAAPADSEGKAEPADTEKPADPAVPAETSAKKGAEPAVDAAGPDLRGN